MKGYSGVIIVMATAFLLSGSGLAAAVPGDTGFLNKPLLIERNGPPAVLYTMLPADSSVLPSPAESVKEEPPASPEQPAAGRAKIPPPSTYFKEFFPDLVHGTGRIFSKDNAPLALIGVGLTALAFTVDHTVQDYFEDQKPMVHPANIGDIIGRGYFPFLFGVVTIGMGEWADNKKLADTGVVTLEALLVTGIATEALKFATERKRPNGGNHMSFPSGHASSTASWAASVSEMYDWDLKIAVPMYMVTAFVGASRIQANEHHLSDVIAGITLGTLVGSSFAKYQKEKGHEKGSATNIAIVPVLDGSCKGLVLIVKF